MSCDANRHKGFTAIASAHEGDAAVLEKTFAAGQSGRAPLRFAQTQVEREIEPVDARWLTAMRETENFRRADGLKILDAIRARAVEKLAGREYASADEWAKETAAINASTLKHSAQVLVLATKIAAIVGADEDTARRAALAAAYHDSDKDKRNFITHGLDSANFAAESLYDDGLTTDATEIAAVRQAIIEHMAFGDGDDPENFMNKALCGEVATLALANRSDRIDYLMREALQKDEATTGRVLDWIKSNANGKNREQLSDALRNEFGGRELAFPKPSSEAARILASAAAGTGEHLDEVKTDANGRSDLERRYSAAEVTWLADGLALSSAESLEKIVVIQQVEWGRAGSEPLVVSMASLAGGFTHKGTAVDAMNAMPLKVVRDTASTEIGLMRRFMGEWQQETWRRFEKAEPGVAATKREQFERDPFTGLDGETMLKHQPSLSEFRAMYADFLRVHIHERGALHRLN